MIDYAEVIQEVDAVVDEMDVPPLQVVIDAMILSVKLTDEMNFGVNFAMLSSANKDLVVSGNGRTLNNTSRFPGNNTSIVPPMGEFIADAAGLKYGFIRGDISAFIAALETISDTNLIASPQLRVLNKQRAQLIIGDRLSYTTTTFSDNQAIENVNFVDVGTKLIIRPFISPDGLIRMEVHPELSSATINEQTGLPDLQTTEVTTNVMVRDGMTVVIGGLIDEQTVESFSRIPFLGALPVIGAAFRNKSESITRNELIVLITPRIVREPDAEIEGDSVRFENERRAEYFQNNLSPINRRNLARMQFQRAQRYFEQGRYLRARDHIERSLRHAKNNLEALRLRDQIEAALGEEKRRWFGISVPSVFPSFGRPIQEVQDHESAWETELSPIPDDQLP